MLCVRNIGGNYGAVIQVRNEEEKLVLRKRERWGGEGRGEVCYWRMRLTKDTMVRRRLKALRRSSPVTE